MRRYRRPALCSSQGFPWGQRHPIRGGGVRQAQKLLGSQPSSRFPGSVTPLHLGSWFGKDSLREICPLGFSHFEDPLRQMSNSFRWGGLEMPWFRPVTSASKRRRSLPCSLVIAINTRESGGASDPSVVFFIKTSLLHMNHSFRYCFLKSILNLFFISFKWFCNRRSGKEMKNHQNKFKRRW